MLDEKSRIFASSKENLALEEAACRTSDLTMSRRKAKQKMLLGVNSRRSNTSIGNGYGSYTVAVAEVPLSSLNN